MARQLYTFIALGLLTLLLLASCANESDSPAGELEHDFDMTVYQGADRLGGEEIKLSDIFEQEKPVILNFWAGQCPPCRTEMPDFERIANEYQNELIMLGVDVGVFTGLGDHGDAVALLDELNISYPAAYTSDAQPLTDYRVLSMPTTVFLSSSGEILDRKTGILLEPELRERTEALLAVE